jgi:hypothetical protein
MPEIKSKFMKAVECPNDPNARKRYEIQSRSQDAILGWIGWYIPWKQYCFTGSNGSIFSHDCMTSIVEFLKELNKEQK